MSALKIGVIVPVTLLLATGCATKNWVKDLVGKERSETDQRVGQVEQRVDSEGRRIDERIGEESRRVDVKVKTVQDSADAARETATGARAQADGALARANEVDGRLTRLWDGRNKRTTVDTVRVLFGFDRFELDDGAQTALLPYIEELKKNPALGVVLEGFTDPRGNRNYNVELSRRRVEAVRRHLVANGVEVWRINSIGMGPLEKAGTSDAEKRRVNVSLVLSE